MIINDINGLDVFADEDDIDSVVTNPKGDGTELRFMFKSKSSMGVTVSGECADLSMNIIQNALNKRRARDAR